MVRRGAVGCVGLRRLRLGWMRHGELCYGEAVMARCVLLGSDMVRRLRWARWGQSGLGGLGIVRRGRVRYVWMRFGGLGMVCSGPFRGVCQGMAVMVRRGGTW